MPRSEIDRRETAAFTAGWAEAMSEELPRIRREYEKRVAEAYAAGGGRGTDTAARSTPAEGEGATVIRLPFATLLEPSPLVVETEERMRRAQEILDRRPDPVPVAEDQPVAGSAEPEPDAAAEREPVAGPPAPAAPRASADARERRMLPRGRKVVRRRGRPIVPPLNAVPVQPRTQGNPAEPPADGPGAAGEPERRSLADKARALAADLETRAGAGRPEVPESSR